MDVQRFPYAQFSAIESSHPTTIFGQAGELGIAVGTAVAGRPYRDPHWAPHWASTKALAKVLRLTAVRSNPPITRELGGCSVDNRQFPRSNGDPQKPAFQKGDQCAS